MALVGEVSKKYEAGEKTSTLSMPEVELFCITWKGRVALPFSDDGLVKQAGTHFPVQRQV